jgi:hypothetical protein
MTCTKKSYHKMNTLHDMYQWLVWIPLREIFPMERAILWKNGDMFWLWRISYTFNDLKNLGSSYIHDGEETLLKNTFQRFLRKTNTWHVYNPHSHKESYQYAYIPKPVTVIFCYCYIHMHFVLFYTLGAVPLFLRTSCNDGTLVCQMSSIVNKR